MGWIEDADMTLPENVFIERRPVKHARLRVAETGEVRLIVPEGLEDGRIAKLLSQKARWISEKRALFMKRAHGSRTVPDLAPHSLLLHGEPYHFSFNSRLGSRTWVNHAGKIVESGLRLDGEETRQAWYRRYAQKHLSAHVAEFAVKYGLPFDGRIYIRDQATKWGNCSRQGNISLNWRLILVPPSARDYVVLHELLHVQLPNHSKAFWSRMRSLMPGYREAVRLLDGYAAPLVKPASEVVE